MGGRGHWLRCSNNDVRGLCSGGQHWPVQAKKQTPSTAGDDHPLRDHTRACRGFGTAAQQRTIKHVGGAAASQNTAAVTDQPAAPIKPDTEQMRMAHERRLAMLRAHTPQSDEP
jgi:hypothetical protein